jgi:hypothetical protein
MENQPINPDPRPEWLINAQAEGTQVEKIVVDGKEYPYTVIKEGLAVGLPYGIGGQPAENTLMISEDAPKEYVPYILAHEIREYTALLDIPENERCRESLKAELEDVKTEKPDRYQAYVNQRADFFDALITLYELPEQKATKSEQFLQGIKSSRDYLHSLKSQ